MELQQTRERGERDKDVELKRLELDHILSLKQLELQHSPAPSFSLPVGNVDPSRPTAVPVPAFRVDTATKRLPRFNENAVEEFFMAVDRTAILNGWPTDKLTAIIQPLLIGKALKTFLALDSLESQDYNKVRAAILKAYSVVPEQSRVFFRTITKQPHETFSEFAFRLSVHFKRWVDGMSSYEDTEKLRELIKIEQFQQAVDADMRVWLLEQKPSTLESAAKLADQYITLRRNIRVGSHRPNSTTHDSSKQFHKSFASESKASKVHTNVTENSVAPQVAREAQPRPELTPRVRCFYCHGVGHVISQCPKRKSNRANNIQPNTSNVMKADVDNGTNGINASIDPLYVPYCCSGILTRPDGTTKSVTLLRDTGALQSLLNSSMVDIGDYFDTGERRFIRGVSGETIPVPLVEATLQSKFCNGLVLCGIAEGLPSGVFGLIGNDLCPKDTDVCVTTRSQTSALTRQVPNAECHTDLSMQIQDSNASANADSTVVESVTDDNPVIDDDDLSLLFNSAVSLPLSAVTSRAELIRLQQEDATLKPLFDFVTNSSDPDLQNDKARYALDRGVLVRYWRDRNAPQIDACDSKQIVVPICLRTSLLQLAHDIPAASHLGQRKTRARLLQHYYWPQVERAIKDYCRTCDRCQRLGKGPNPSKAPLQSLTLETEPFKRLIIDIVGPLPECKDSGNRFILTVMDACTHYPEAIPLRQHTAKDVAVALVSVWSRFGFPEEIQSDQGSDFMSELMQVFLTEFHISQIKSSIVHPQSQGAIERFHATLKNMLRALSDRFPDNWDSALPWVLFAYREVPVETLGFSPFELLFARSVKGPLSLVKQAWLSDDELEKAKPNVIEFVLDTRNRLRDAIAMANEHAAGERKKAKAWYDRNARSRSFEVGQKVLVLLPVHGKGLQAKYYGPYEVMEKIGNVDYLVATHDRRKTRRICHVNLLKPYLERDAKNFPPPDVTHVAVVETGDEVNNGIEDPTDPLRHLNEDQKLSMQTLLSEFKDIFSDVPGQTTLIEHNITLQADAKPFHCSPYRLSPDKTEFVKQELVDLKRLGIITDAPPESPWAAPIVVVRKADGGWRLCTDFRRLNQVTVPDPYPLPRIEDLLDRLGKAKYLTKVDMSKGYHQVPLAREAIPLTGFVTPFGHFCWRYMPFGLRNAPATFSRLVSKLLHGCETFCVAYLDDLLIFSETWEDHVKHLEMIFGKVRDAGLTLKLSKCEFAAAELDFLGHHVGLGKLQPREQKVLALLQFPRPTNRKSLQSYLGLAGYFRRFIPHFSEITAVLSDLLKKNTKYVWTDKCEQAFVDLKSRLATRPILRPPNYSLPFHVAVDTSAVAIGAYLFQIVDNLEHPICFLSRKLNKHQLHYSTVEKEAYGLLIAIRAFSVYFGSASVVVYTDHSPLQFLHRMSNHNQKLLRWNLELQQYNLTIVHRAGRDNVLPDLLSRPPQ